VQATALRLQARQLDPAGAAEELDCIVRRAGTALGEARRAVWDLRSPAEPGLELHAALHEEALATAAGSPVHVRVEVRGTPARARQEAQDQLLRITREAVANSVRHAHASRIDLEFAYEGGEIMLRVRDDGVGFDPARVAQGHFGLVGMRERVSAFGGSLRAGPVPGGGFVVDASFPLPRRWS